MNPLQKLVMKKDIEHLNLLAIFHYIGAVLIALFTLFPLIYVFLGVMNLPDNPELDIEMRHLAVPLPDEIELQDLPLMVTRKVPMLDAYKFVKLGDRILVINPDSRVVVAQIPRYRVVLQ